MVAVRSASRAAELLRRTAVLSRMEEADDENVRRSHGVADDIAVAALVHGRFAPALLGLHAHLRIVLKQIELLVDGVERVVSRSRRSFREPIDLRVEVEPR